MPNRDSLRSIVGGNTVTDVSDLGPQELKTLGTLAISLTSEDAVTILGLDRTEAGVIGREVDTATPADPDSDVTSPERGEI